MFLPSACHASYNAAMRHTRFRRLCALVLVVAFGLGAALHGVLAASMAAQMTAMAMSDDGQPSGCGGCGSDGGMAPSDCTQMCVGFAAVVPPDPSAAKPAATTIPLERVAAVVGRTGPPEPYPPRTFAIV